MATATRNITETQTTFTEVLVAAKDITSLTDHVDGRRCLKLGSLYVYVDGDGVTKLLELLLLEHEASHRPELLDELTRCVDVLRHAAELEQAV